MTKQYEHLNESEDCPVCGIEFAHRHLDDTKPKEFIYQGLRMKRPMEGESSPDGKASVAFADKEWWSKYVIIDDAGYPTIDAKWLHAILAEHTGRIVEAVEGMRQEIKLLGNYERGCDKHLSATEECHCYGWNAALDEAIKKISQLSA